MPERIIDVVVINGLNTINIDFDTSNLGLNELTLQLFYPIEADAEVLLASDITKINVEVIGEQESIVKFVDVKKSMIEKQNIFQKLWNWIRNLFR